MTIEWPQFASPVNGFVFNSSRRRFGQKRTAITDPIAPIWIHADRGSPK
jgi:hypothetical protein